MRKKTTKEMKNQEDDEAELKDVRSIRFRSRRKSRRRGVGIRRRRQRRQRRSTRRRQNRIKIAEEDEE